MKNSDVPLIQGETKEAEMKMVVLCAAVGGMLVSTLPASAEVVIRDRDNVVVREHVDHGYHHGWRSHAECRTVRVRTTLPNGNVVVKTRRSC